MTSRLPVPPRMSDVAERAGLSKVTVSRVPAGHSVSQATRERVQKVIDELGYVADAAAGALSSGRSEFVAMLVPSLSSSNFSDRVRGLNAALGPHGFLLGDTDYRLDQEELPDQRNRQPVRFTGSMITAVATNLTDDVNNGTYALGACLLVSCMLILLVPRSMLTRPTVADRNSVPMAKHASASTLPLIER